MDKHFWIQVLSFLFLVVQHGSGVQTVTEIQNGNSDHHVAQLTKEEQLGKNHLSHTSTTKSEVTDTFRNSYILEGVNETKNETPKELRKYMLNLFNGVMKSKLADHELVQCRRIGYPRENISRSVVVSFAAQKRERMFLNDMKKLRRKGVWIQYFMGGLTFPPTDYPEHLTRETTKDQQLGNKVQQLKNYSVSQYNSNQSELTKDQQIENEVTVKRLFQFEQGNLSFSDMVHPEVYWSTLKPTRKPQTIDLANAEWQSETTVTTRNSFILEGITETKDETFKGLRKYMLMFLQEVLKSNVTDHELSQCHRIGPIKENVSRPILVSFISERREKLFLNDLEKLKKLGISVQYYVGAFTMPPREIVSVPRKDEPGI